MKLYHLSFDLDQPKTKTFIPRIPSGALEDEDKSIPRICLSRNILGCVNALSAFNRTDIDKNWDDKSTAYKAVLYSIDIDDIPSSALIGSVELYERGLVADAIITQEHWCLSPITMKGTVVRLLEGPSEARAVLYSAKEKNRDFIYSVIDDLYDNFATRNKGTLDKFSLFYIMNYYFKSAGMWDRYGIDDCDLDFKLCEIANTKETAHLVDAFNEYYDVYLNDVVHSLRPHGLKYRTSSDVSSQITSPKPNLSDIISRAELRRAEQQCNQTVQNKELIR